MYFVSLFKKSILSVISDKLPTSSCFFTISRSYMEEIRLLSFLALIPFPDLFHNPLELFWSVPDIPFLILAKYETFWLFDTFSIAFALNALILAVAEAVPDSTALLIVYPTPEAVLAVFLISDASIAALEASDLAPDVAIYSLFFLVNKRWVYISLLVILLPL